MKAGDVTDTLDLALTASGCDQAKVVHRSRLLPDNGSSYVAADLADWLDAKNMKQAGRMCPFCPRAIYGSSGLRVGLTMTRSDLSDAAE